MPYTPAGWDCACRDARGRNGESKRGKYLFAVTRAPLARTRVVGPTQLFDAACHVPIVMYGTVAVRPVWEQTGYPFADLLDEAAELLDSIVELLRRSSLTHMDLDATNVFINVGARLPADLSAELSCARTGAARTHSYLHASLFEEALNSPLETELEGTAAVYFMQYGHITARANPLILASVPLVAGGVDGSEAALITDLTNFS